MSEENIEATGPTCLYKDGGSEIFEGDAVAEALDDGWTDEPVKAKPKAKSKAKDKS